jgi:hypothetical protein
MKLLMFVLPLTVVLLLAGCAPSKSTFYWGDYSSTLYDFKKNPDEKTLDAHKKSLLKIMTESGKKKKQIPPGVQAEYGYILLKAGEEAAGMEYLDKETTLYPESLVFIQRIKTEYARGKK